MDANRCNKCVLMKSLFKWTLAVSVFAEQLVLRLEKP